MKRNRTSIPRIRRSLLPVAHSLSGSKVVAGLRYGMSRQILQENAPSLLQVVSELTRSVEQSG